MNLKQLQLEVKQWTDHNFPGQVDHHPLLGIVEEVGELTHAHLKMEQAIRQDEDLRSKQIDAVGDILIYLANYCNRAKINMDDAVEIAWDEVKHRDWIKYPNSKGLPPK